MGRVRKRRSTGRGTRYQAIARLDGREVPLGTHDTFEDAVDAWQRAEVDASRASMRHPPPGTRPRFGLAGDRERPGNIGERSRGTS